MKKTIYVLPQKPEHPTCEEFANWFESNWELAATIDYIPDSLKTLKAIDYTQLKILMNQNVRFFNAAIELCAVMIKDLLRVERAVATELLEEGEIEKDDYEIIQNVNTLDELLNSGYYCDDYEDAKGEFITVLLEDHLFNTRR